MPLFAVAIDTGPPPPPPPLAQVLVSACTEALAEGSCVLAGKVGEGQAVPAQAVVVWDDPDRQNVRIWVAFRRETSVDRVERTMRFGAADDPAERWRTVGLMIGTLVGRTVGPGAPGAAPAPTPEPGAPARPGRRPPEGRAPRGSRSAGGQARPAGRHHRPVWASAGALTGPGFDSGMWRWGGWLRGGYAFESVPLMFCGAVSYALRPEDEQGLAAHWVSVGGGGGVHASVPSVRLGLDARLEVVADRFGVSAADKATGAEESGSHWRPAARLGLDAWWPDGEIAAATLGTEGWASSGTTSVELRGVPVAQAIPLGFALLAGIRIALP
ncbi:MAG: hypothetical protein HY744_08500 [Deltaproteobacteria bacterium]|nr:hypothetical protein [Deltaproteobacteria bacterium]